MNQSTYSEAEIAALTLMLHRGSLLTSQIEAKNETDGMGFLIPGRGVFAKLERKGLCFETEEEPMDDGFVFTSTMELTDFGRNEANRLLGIKPAASRLAPAKPGRR